MAGLGSWAPLRKMSTVILFGVAMMNLLTGSAPAAEDKSSPPPTLAETLQWLSGASEAESADGHNHYSFESDTAVPCSVAITETRVAAGPNFWIKMAFSLSDIDPEAIRTENLAQGKFAKDYEGSFAVGFHTTNYTKRLTHTSSSVAEPIKASEYTIFTNDEFAPKFARALKRAVVLCGGHRSSF